MAMRPLHTSIALDKVTTARLTVLRAISDGVIDLQEQRDIRRTQDEAEGASRHADNRQRLSQALSRDTTDVVYLETLWLKGGVSDGPEAA